MTERTNADLPTAPSDDGKTIRVWDLFIRVFHWSLVLAFFTAYLVEDEILALHVWAGYLIGGLLVLRLVWGFAGPRHARFADFIYRPTKIFAYLGALARFKSERYLGHSPAGGAMVFVLLAGLTVITWSGLELYAVEEHGGPLATVQSVSLNGVMGFTSEHDSEEFWEELHEIMANIILGMIFLHVLGVVWTSLAHKENLPRSMVTGRKRRNR